MSPFTGCVLTGGSSRRMGADKALLTVEGRPLVLRVADSLADADEVAVVGGDRDALGALGIEVWADCFPGEGPLGGLVCALSTAAHPEIVVFATDLPDLTTTVPGRLLDARRVTDADVAVGLAGGRAQWMVAVWHARCHDELARRFDAGERAIWRAVRDLRVTYVVIPEPLVTDIDTADQLRRRANPGPSD